MIRRTYLGLDIRGGELRAVALRRRGRSAILDNGRFLTLGQGVLRPDLRADNIRDRKAFVEGLREVLDPLAGKEERVAVGLPEGAGRVLIQEFDTGFRSHEEGIDIVKWHLKGNLPADPAEVRLDYQVLERHETNRVRVLVGLLARDVLQSYEEALTEAGYGAQLVDFHPLHLYNFYRPRLEATRDFILVAVDQGGLSCFFFQDGALVFYRGREIDRQARQVFQEVSRTLAGLPERVVPLQRLPVYIHCDWPDSEAVVAAVNAAFGREGALLEANLQRFTQEPPDFPAWRIRSLAGAIGAAERLL